MVIYCPNRYKTERIYDEAVDDCMKTLKFIPNWFDASKILEKFHDTLLHEDFTKVTFFSDQVGILAVDVDRINPE